MASELDQTASIARPRGWPPLARFFIPAFVLVCLSAGPLALHPSFARSLSYSQGIADTDPSLSVLVSDEEDCVAWHQKALAGNWFSEAEAAAFAASESRESTMIETPACKAFFDLQNKCDSTYIGWLAGDKPLQAVVSAIDSTPGCKVIIGFSNVCGALREFSQSGKKLSKSGTALLTQCANDSIAGRTGAFVKPAL